MIHLEDLLIYGKDGTEILEYMMYTLISCASGVDTSHVKVKVDGSPAVVVATDFNGEKFVALKHSWEKGKRFHTDEEIDIAYDDSRVDLKKKLKMLLYNLSFINIPKNEIWMGDILYSKSDLKDETINNKEYLVFKPNTLVYAVPINCDLANIIKKSDIGVAWHTKYTGEDFNNLTRFDSIDLTEVNLVPTVYQMSTEDIITSSFLSDSENIVVDKLFEDLCKELQELKNNELYEVLVSNKKLVQRLLKYRNDLIRQYSCEYDGLYTAEAFIATVSKESDEHVNSLKTERGKLKSLEEFNQYKSALEGYKDVLNLYFETQRLACKLKNLCIDKINQGLEFETFYEEDNNYRPCSGEGFVLYDFLGNICKAVCRTDFSLMNFKRNQN